MTASGEAPQALETPETKPDFLEVYARWVSPIYRYFRSHVGEDPLAEDLTSQLFLKAYQAWPRFEPKRSLAAWLFRIAHNLAMDHYRAARRSRNYLEEAALPSIPWGPSGPIGSPGPTPGTSLPCVSLPTPPGAPARTSWSSTHSRTVR